MIVVGIDPGLTGALAFIEADGRAHLADMPTVALPGDGMVGRRVDGRALAELLRLQCPAGAAVSVACEAVHALAGGNAIQTQGSLLRTLGAIEAVFDVLRWPCALVAPQTWQRHYGLTGKKREKREPGELPAAVQMAARLYPSAAHDMRRVRDHNRAEALLIAHWWRAQVLG